MAIPSATLVKTSAISQPYGKEHLVVYKVLVIITSVTNNIIKSWLNTYQQHDILANRPTFGKNGSNKNKYCKDQHSTHTIKSGCHGKNNIFPYTRWSHVSWTGKSFCSLKSLFCFREIELPYWKSNRMRSLHSLKMITIYNDILYHKTHTYIF